MTENPTENQRPSEFANLPIPENEKRNLSDLFGLIRKKNVGVGLEVVGGVTKKPWPRKDIDVTVEVEEEQGASELEKSQKEYERMLKLAEEAEIESKGFFKISHKKPPFTDHDFNNNNILAHDGTIDIQPSEGTTIELIKKRIPKKPNK